MGVSASSRAGVLDSVECIFVAGAGGAVGRRLVALLKREGYRVFGTTRSPEKTETVRVLGAEPVVVDVFDADALLTAVIQVRPAVIIHQLTDLPPGLDPARMPAALLRNARLREEGTRNLVSAGLRAGVRRFIAQSIAFAYALGPLPHKESDPLNIDAEGVQGVSARAVASLEQQVLGADFEGVILRYGRFYGPGTGSDGMGRRAPVHVDAAAKAAQLAIGAGSGIYNIAEDDGEVDITRARAELGWTPAFRLD